MDYCGKYDYFDFGEVRTYPIAERKNLVKVSNLLDPATLKTRDFGEPTPELAQVAGLFKECAKEQLPIIVFTGAHLIKNGLSRILIEWMKEGRLSHVATSGAGAIHDLELAMIGETSEDVPDALKSGKFGLAQETGGSINRIVKIGNEKKLGFGECMGRALTGTLDGMECHFPSADASLMANAFKCGIPFTVHAAIGADIINGHPDFDGEAVGGTSGRDFGVFAASVAKCCEGGLFINIGSAVMGPEVLLKAVAVAANADKGPRGINTAVFDFRRIGSITDVRNSEKPSYYFRDLKSVVVRIPEAFGGKGFYVQGDIRETLPHLYRIVEAG